MKPALAIRSLAVPVFSAVVAISALSAVAALAAETPPPAAPPSLPVGKVITRIACAGSPDQSYALYLPKGYTTDRAWPILYVMDPRSRGDLAASLFRTGAEKYGYVVASSNNSTSDSATDPNIAAMRAMWTDSHRRLRIDDHRVYAAGFSGTVRSACILARTAPGTLAGIVGAGAGFPFDGPPRKGDSFVFFGTVGDKDFNYYEMADLEPKLAAAGIPHRVEIFDGIHQWPPKELATRALGWLEIQAMKAGTRAKDPALVDGLWSETLARAAAAEGAGDLFQAYRLYDAAAEDFGGLRDTKEASGKAAAIAASPSFQRDAKDRALRLKHDEELLEEAPAILANVGSGEPATVAQVAAAMKIAELRDKAKNGKEADERLSAQRVLNNYLVQTSYYLPRMYDERKQYDRAVFMLSLAAEIDPDDPFIWYNRAASYARKGDRKRALADLREAVDKGWTDGAALAGDEAFSSLRQDPDYLKLASELAPPRPAGGSR
jgi:tetratricopeptide (TPR) repeat protein